MTNVLILEPSTSGLQVLKAAHQMNLNAFVLSANQDERIIPEEYDKYIFKKIQVDTNDLDAISHATLELHKQYGLSAIIPGFEIYVELAARLAQLIQAPGIGIKTAMALRNKGKMRDALKSNNVRTPRYALLSSVAELASVAKYVGFPCVIKPIDQSGSMHVSRLNNMEELDIAYFAMCNDSWTEMNKGIGSIAIVEEYINGEEFSVEGYIDGENIEIVSITKKFLIPEPLFIEMGHIVPADIVKENQEIIKEYVRQVVVALDINLGVFHAELRVDDNGAVLMEIAGRLPGCRICDLILLAKDINMYETMIKAHLGWSIEKKQDITLQYAGMCYFDLNGKSCFQQVNGLEELKSIPGFYDFKLFKKAGEYVPQLTTFEGRVASCIFIGDTYHEVFKRLEQARLAVSFC